MTSFAIEPAGADRLEVRGALTFATAAEALAQGQRLIGASANCTVGLAGVDAADSAGLAVLIEWLALSRARGVRLRYEGVPARIAAVARISNVEDLLAGA